MIRVAIFISGGGSNMVSLLKAMQDPKFGAEPVLVLANSSRAGGIAKAKKYGVATEVVEQREFSDRAGFEAASGAVLNTYKPDVICLAGFMQVLSAEFTSRWNNRILNIHPSLLPKFKGLNTHQRALDAAESHSGCTVHLVSAALDDGPILAQAQVPILPQDTASDVALRVLKEEHRLYPDVLRQYIKTL